MVILKGNIPNTLLKHIKRKVKYITIINEYFLTLIVSSKISEIKENKNKNIFWNLLTTNKLLTIWDKTITCTIPINQAM